MFQTPDIQTLIQEVIDDTTGQLNDLTFVMQDDVVSGSTTRDVESFDTTSGEAPFVTIEYTAGGGGPTVGELMAARQIDHQQPAPEVLPIGV